MPEYEVLVPIAGYTVVRVKAEDEKAAIDAAMNTSISIDDIEQWDTYKLICDGNFFWAEENRARILGTCEED